MAKRSPTPTPIATSADYPAEVGVATITRKPSPALPAATSAPVSSSAAVSDSKQSRLVALLRRAEGATVAELMAATGWMSHSVRGALSAVVKRKLGLAVDSRLEPDRGRVYRVTPPPMTKPATGRRKAKPAVSQASVSHASASSATARAS